MNTNDGGPAFPKPDCAEMHSQSGMTLRDYFAAKAIPEAINTRPFGFVNWCRWLMGLGYNGPKPEPGKVARQAYAVADAMLAERQKAQG